MTPSYRYRSLPSCLLALVSASHAFLPPPAAPRSGHALPPLPAGVSDTIVEGDLTTVTVPLGEGRNYPIYIGPNLSDRGALLRAHVLGKRVLVVTNDVVAPLHLARYVAMLGADGSLTVDTHVLPDGEVHKTMDVVMTIIDKAMALRLDRKCTFVALGGGVIGDMVGFAASLYQRGVNFIQVPTTVMAMVDSSVGGKTGVNHPLGKNMIGAFYQPQCVFIDLKSLNTLPDRELCSGVSEIIKYGLIRDADFFEWMEEHVPALVARDAEAMAMAVRRSCENKAEVVAADEREAGLRATLNLGHTFGHAVETGSGYGTYLHGEAVAIGTAMAVSMSARMEWIDQTLLRRVYKIFEAAKQPLELPLESPMNKQLFLDLMAGDKKVADGLLRLILLKGELGNCVFTGEFDRGAMEDTIEDFVAECAGAAAEVKAQQASPAV